MDNAVSSSGAPRKIVGIKSRKVWVIAIAVMKIIRTKGETKLRKYAENPNKTIAIRFMWIPGIRPVIVPIVHPSNKAIIISINILL